MPRRFGRRRADEPSPVPAPSTPPRPPVGVIEEIPYSDPPPPEPVAEPPAVLTVAGEFRTASAALVFAGGLADLDGAEFGRAVSAGTWWVATSSTLPVARDVIIAAGGRVHVEVDGQLVPDHGWGDPPSGPPAAPGPQVDRVGVLELVRTAGLHPCAAPASGQVTVLAPAVRVTAIVQRALDLSLAVGTRLLRLDPLYAAEADPAAPTMFELSLTASAGSLPAAVLAALDRDVCVLACRRVSDRLLVQRGLASALPDDALAAVAAREGVGAGWLLADAGFGSARLSPLTDFRDGAALVRLSDRHPLPDLDDDWAAIARSAATPEPAPLRLVRARTPEAAVDAVLLDDNDLTCLPALLAGRPLAELATLAAGRDQHLMLAPGGILERLPVGEPLYRLGPGPLYLPLGTRTQPQLPPSARQELFRTTAETALVLLPDAIRAFPLAGRVPVWTLWAGPLPPLDLQLPRDARRALAEVDEQTTPGRAPEQRSVAGRLADRVRGAVTERPQTWQDEALAAELAGDLVRAAELCERNGELRRAAYLYERAARQPAADRGTIQERR